MRKDRGDWGGGGGKRRDVEGQKMEREDRRSTGSVEGDVRQKQLQHSIWILLAAVGKI